MKRNILIVLLLLFNVSLFAADTFTINGRDITVPVPQGYVRVTDDMTLGKRYLQQIDEPMNDTLATYIMESDVPAAMAGEMPSLERTFALKVNKELRNITIGKNDFSELKSLLKENYQKLTEEKTKALISEPVNDLSQEVSQEFDVDIDINISQVVHLESHFEDENAIAFSMYFNTEVSAKEFDIVGVDENSVTTTCLNTAGPVLLLYSYASKDELDWTRSASISWAKSVMASNSQPPVKSPRRGIDWNKAVEVGLSGAIGGGLFVLLLTRIATLFKRNK